MDGFKFGEQYIYITWGPSLQKCNKTKKCIDGHGLRKEGDFYDTQKVGEGHNKNGAGLGIPTDRLPQTLLTILNSGRKITGMQNSLKQFE